MMKSTRISGLIVSAFLLACGGSVPAPDDPDSKKRAHCEELSKDATVGCKACAGLEFCAWKQTTSPNDGTCHFIQDPIQAPFVKDPLHCPAPE